MWNLTIAFKVKWEDRETIDEEEWVVEGQDFQEAAQRLAETWMKEHHWKHSEVDMAWGLRVYGAEIGHCHMIDDDGWDPCDEEDWIESRSEWLNDHPSHQITKLEVKDAI